VHRDFKPDNVALIEREGLDEHRLTVKVLDFGVAKLLHHDGPEAVVGTLPYLAPEMASGASADLRCDVYAFGVVLYEMLTGAPPVEPLTATEFHSVHARGFPLRLRELRPDVSVGLASLIEKCLSPRPEDRGTSLHWVIRRLEQIGARSSASVDSTWATPKEPVSRFRTAWASMFTSRRRAVA
jgi:serine/threonine-protein kinase